jgi:hypothetical protein
MYVRHWCCIVFYYFYLTSLHTQIAPVFNTSRFFNNNTIFAKQKFIYFLKFLAQLF